MAGATAQNGSAVSRPDASFVFGCDTVGMRVCPIGNGSVLLSGGRARLSRYGVLPRDGGAISSAGRLCEGIRDCARGGSSRAADLGLERRGTPSAAAGGESPGEQTFGAA